jgi:putative copper export protein
MVTILEATYAVHLLAAGLWAGGVAFVTFGVLPSARGGAMDRNRSPPCSAD